MTKKSKHSPSGATPMDGSHDNSEETSLIARPAFDFSVWLKNHKQALFRALFHLSHNRFATIITILVIATTLALPAMLEIANSNLEGKEDSLPQHSGLSVFLKQNVSAQNVERLKQSLLAKPEVKKIDYISPTQAMQEFQQSLGLPENALTKSNPLPPVLYITPAIRNFSTDNIEKLKAEIAASSDVDIIQVDVHWIRKLLAIGDLIKNIVVILAVFLIFTILVVIGNTIRLLAQHYHDEILISKLMGATDAYVRRPFLYSGLLFGLSGAMTACILVFIGFLWIYPEINNLIEAYGSQIQFSGLSFADILSILGIGALLGVGGAWLASNRIINEIGI
ncbi:MAG: permease-like cell division protein FtsX [Gammaproteobacteria bacterium]|nr:permease-like cell division protein FtsX [Gammaproteobacteria bacterium]